jgi:hypothetical protein
MTPCPLTHFVFCRRDKHDGLPRLRLVARCLSNARASDRLTLDAGYARAARDRFAAVRPLAKEFAGNARILASPVTSSSVIRGASSGRNTTCSAGGSGVWSLS